RTVRVADRGLRMLLAFGQLLRELRLGVGLALVLGGDVLERRARLLLGDVVAAQASALLAEILGRHAGTGDRASERGAFDHHDGFPHASSFAGPRRGRCHSGAVWAMPLWQSTQVAWPASTCSCIGRTNSFCFARISLLNAWQLRQAWELL